MADVEFSHGMGAYGRDVQDPAAQAANPAQTVTHMTNLAGAVVSLALIAGVGVWGYELMVRDVSGIPVVRAAEGDMRVRPEEPGGQLARHQGLAVNAIAAVGVAEGPVDRVVLAPPAMALSVEDQPVVAAAPIVAPAPLAPAAAPAQDSVEAPNAADAEIADQLQSGDIDAVVAALLTQSPQDNPATGAKTVQARQVSAEAETTQVASAEVQAPKVLDAPGVRSSKRPRLRPASAPALLQPASFSTPEPTPEINAAAIPSGTRLAQLGAFDSADVARQEWSRLETRFGDYLQGKSRVVQEAQSGGRTFYRLRAMGFVGLNDTRRFCSAFKAEGVDCIPVQVK